MQKRGASVLNIVLLIGLLAVSGIVIGSLSGIHNWQSRESELEMAEYLLDKVKLAVEKSLTYPSDAVHTITVPFAESYTLEMNGSTLTLNLTTRDISVTKTFFHPNANILYSYMEDSGKIRIFSSSNSVMIAQRADCKAGDGTCDPGCVIEHICDPDCGGAEGVCNPYCADSNHDLKNNRLDVDGICDPDCGEENAICDPDCIDDIDCHEGNGVCEPHLLENCGTGDDCACPGSERCCDGSCIVSPELPQASECICTAECASDLICQSRHCCPLGKRWDGTSCSAEEEECIPVSAVEPSIFPELFTYSEEKNQNLADALASIGAGFREEGIPVTPEILAAVMATLTKEVGGTFLPVEEYGDYCMGPGCTYTVGGSCRGSPYQGGCDYKGRGYIQITHKDAYERFCGAECLSSSPDECDCNGQWQCLNQDCPPSKALEPALAGKIFAAFYEYKGLIDLCAARDFWTVGKRINGGDSYGDAFKPIAEDFLSLFQSDNAKTSALIAAMAGGTVECPEDLEDGGACGSRLVEIAKSALGSPYCLGSAEWDEASDPPAYGSCPGVVVEYPDMGCTHATYASMTQATGKCGTDCGAFTKWIYAHYAEEIGDDSFKLTYRTAGVQARDDGRVVDHDPTKDHDQVGSIMPNMNVLKPGDLIFFDTGWTTRKPNHVGMYIGGGQFIHAGDPINIQQLDSPSWQQKYLGAKRLCPDEERHQPSGETCSYCGAGKQKLQDYYPDQVCGDNCCRASCPPDSVLVEIPYYCQYTMSYMPGSACGPTSLKMALEGLTDRSVDIGRIWDFVGNPPSGAAMWELESATEDMTTVDARSVNKEYNWNNLKRLIDSGNVLVQLSIMQEWNDYTAGRTYSGGHYFVIHGYSEDEIIISDPAPTNYGETDQYEYGSNLVIDKSTYLDGILQHYGWQLELIR